MCVHRAFDYSNEKIAERIWEREGALWRNDKLGTSLLVVGFCFHLNGFRRPIFNAFKMKSQFVICLAVDGRTAHKLRSIIKLTQKLVHLPTDHLIDFENV